MIWNKNLFPPLNAINVYKAPYVSKGVIRHYNYRSDPKVGLGIVDIKIITRIFHACTTQLFLPWYYTINKACNHPIYGRVYYCNYSLIIVSNNNWLITNVIYYKTYNVEYKHINIIILDGNARNMYLIITKGNYGDIYAGDNSFHGYYIIRFSSSAYTFQSYFNIYGRVIFLVKWHVEEIVISQ